MLFEAACFDGTNIRLSSKKVGLRTDASSKFEKGLDPNTAMEAINRACQLVEELGAGEVVGGVVDVYSKVRTGNRVPFDADYVNRLLGTNVDRDTMIGYFKKIDLGFDEETSEVIVPSWRQDLLRPATWQRKWQDFTAMPTFRPPFLPARRPQENCPSRCALRQWQEISQNSVVSARA